MVSPPSSRQLNLLLTLRVVKQSSHFIQAHALLNLHIIHSAQASTNGQPSDPLNDTGPQNEHASTHAIHRLSPPISAGPGAGFRIYSPLTANPHQSPSGLFTSSTGNGAGSGEEAPVFLADFSAYQLLRVMNRLAQPGTRALPYFLLCREMGAKAIDGMVKGRILDLRWTEPVSREFADPYYGRMSARVRDSIRAQLGRGPMGMGMGMSMGMSMGPSASGRATSMATTAAMGPDADDLLISGATAVDEPEGVAAPAESVGAGAGTSSRPRASMRPETVYEDMEPMSDEEVLQAHERLVRDVAMEDEEDEDEEVLGPKLVPISPIMRFAMMEVVQEYYADEDRTESEYASLSDADIQEY